MNPYKTSAQLKAAARKHLKGNYGTIIGCLLLYYLTAGILSIVSEMFGVGNSASQTIIFFIAVFIISILTLKLKFGLTKCILKLCCNEKPSINDLFSSLGSQGGCTTGMAFAITLIQILCLVPYFIGEALIPTDNMYGVISLTVLSVLSFALIIYSSIIFIPTYYLVHDIPNKTTLQLILLSIWLVKGRKFKLFLIILSFIPLYLLGALSCGIGLLFVIPYALCTECCFYLDLSNIKSSKAE